ncbi:unnamed protein product [Staurois parvus]|uniref:Uncharacterized protein n=1 Tax=Staurois parvus TaxID=386267 RepID=A0ABN9BS51_9NEOB|nr:unnamed protein product [Staurois parvus]
MCNVSVSDNIITIPQPALLVPAGPADLCQCVLCVCVWAGLPAVTAFYLPPPIAWRIPAWDLSVWIHHPPLTATLTLPLPATDTVHP